jgi:hypothetical protein
MYRFATDKPSDPFGHDLLPPLARYYDVKVSCMDPFLPHPNLYASSSAVLRVPTNRLVPARYRWLAVRNTITHPHHELSYNFVTPSVLVLLLLLSVSERRAHSNSGMIAESVVRRLGIFQLQL